MFREMELSSPKIKIFLIFNPKKKPTLEKFLILSKEILLKDVNCVNKEY